ncbi:hypothetical protein ASG87_01380 [Frateuria sp. Soil773]|uniref:hypothetical protein n=1 Tax=Frateuria sp. Soil773 TaxID=1736407 RepID=UPI0006FB8CAC|nr:hypothetical protein [Frateuria sp. Soil773]KRE90815.1 hypothetical protein ASG87_01380 [Frateuria sp. Soil773]
MSTKTITNTTADLRDQFAMAALTDLLASEEGISSHWAADRAYEVADEMLFARDQPRQEKNFCIHACNFICMETGADNVSRWSVKVADGGRGFELEVKADAEKDELFYDAPFAFLYDEEETLYDKVGDAINIAMGCSAASV